MTNNEKIKCMDSHWIEVMDLAENKYLYMQKEKFLIDMSSTVED